MPSLRCRYLVRETGIPCQNTVHFGAANCETKGHIIPATRWYPHREAKTVRHAGKYWTWLVPGVFDKASQSFLRTQHRETVVLLAEKLNAPLVFVANHNEEDAKKTWTQMMTADRRLEDAQANLRWTHAMVQVGDDKFLDVDGVHTGDELIKRHCRFRRPRILENGDASTILVPTDAQQLRRLPYLATWRVKMDTKNVEPFVDAVLARYARDIKEAMRS